MANAPDIIASYWTIAGDVLPHAPSMASAFPLKDRIEAAGRAGFTGMGFAFDDAAASRARYTDADIRAMFAANGIRWIEVEALLDWFADGDRRAASDAQRARAFDQARAFGAFQIKVAGDLAGDWPLDRMAEAFGQLCDEAAVEGLRVTLELLPISNLPSIERAMQVVGAAGRHNGGMMFDAWHIDRGDIALADIAALPRGLCSGIELDDGPAERVMENMYEEMIHCRALPGEGDFDVVGLVRAAHDAGFDGPYGIEILSRENRARSLDTAASAAFASARATIEAARETVA